VHDNVAVCGDVPNVTLGGRVHVRPAGVDAETDKFTVPVNPFTGATVMVDVAVVPAFTLMLVGLAVTEKSWTVYVTVAM